MEKTDGTKELWRIIGLFPDGENKEDVIRVRNGYQFKKFLWFRYKKYNKVDGKVLTKDSIKYCQEKLPTQEGFFFGSTDYDEHYYNDLVYTKERLNYILENYNLSKDKVYYSSSW